MTEKAFRQLNIDPEFKNLIRPLRREEYRQLELNLVVEGCREDSLWCRLTRWSLPYFREASSERELLEQFSLLWMDPAPKIRYAGVASTLNAEPA